MLSKAEIKFLRSLSQKKVRDELGIFVVEGDKMVEEAIRSDFHIERVLRIDEIGEECMSRITLLSSPSPSFALLKMKSSNCPVEIEKNKLYLALDSVRDPGNMGTILRLADWFGIDTVFASQDTVDIYNPKTVQASMGAIFRVNTVYTDLCGLLKKASLATEVYGTFLNGPSIYETKLSGKGIIVMGSESNGISEKVEILIKNRLYIPSFTNKGEGSESLNVAIASAIVCSEFRRSSV